MIRPASSVMTSTVTRLPHTGDRFSTLAIGAASRT